MKAVPEDWFDMETAPKDGQPILACRYNGCGWEHAVVWWTGRDTYPWQADHTAYPVGRLDYWQSLTMPYHFQDRWNQE